MSSRWPIGDVEVGFNWTAQPLCSARRRSASLSYNKLVNQSNSMWIAKKKNTYIYYICFKIWLTISKGLTNVSSLGKDVVSVSPSWSRDLFSMSHLGRWEMAGRSRLRYKTKRLGLGPKGLICNDCLRWCVESKLFLFVNIPHFYVDI